jgi:N-acetylglucosamine-6-phosphate deacetylase
MAGNPTLFRGNLILPDRVLDGGTLRVEGGKIASVGQTSAAGTSGKMIDAGDGYIAPGFVDLHVHGGAGADFMDGTEAAFITALKCQARHGTTSLAATTTVARHEQIMTVLETARRLKKRADAKPADRNAAQPADRYTAPGSRVMGVHFYGPYFRLEAKGAHPGAAIRPPVAEEYLQYLEYADSLVTCTVAPELPGAKEFALACKERGVRTNVGHSWATFEQMAQAVEWGVRHIDHLFCAMSDKTRLRQFQMYPMQGGVLEATLFFDELTTEVIADGKHLSHDLLKLALKIKGPDRLALVTDCSRALDMPDGEYLIGPLDGGEPIIKRDGVGMMPDMKALGSSVEGMDHMIRTFLRLTGRPLFEVIRMATLTPARIAGWEREIGSLEIGKRADIVVLSRDLEVQRVFRDGVEL